MVESFTKTPLWHNAKKQSALSYKSEQDLKVNKIIPGELLRCRACGWKERGWIIVLSLGFSLSLPLKTPCAFRNGCFVCICVL